MTTIIKHISFFLLGMLLLYSVIKTTPQETEADPLGLGI